MSDATEGAPRQKTAKELEKERKKAEKLAQFEAKQAKLAAKQASAKEKKPKAKKEVEPTPKFEDKTTPGEKKILVSIDDPSLKAYDPQAVESSWYNWWKKEGMFEPKFQKDGSILPAGRFCVPAPPPNVTGALHIGHALTVAIQDTLVRYNRMKGKTTLFIPGFDHAGISTQSVVEKMLWNKEKKTRHDLGREKFIDLVWEWKEEYHERIRKQFEAMGASFAWSYEAFTLDEKRSKAVAEAFVRLFEDGTIYRANRLVNWCVALNTTLSNLELKNQEIPGRTLLKVPGYTEKVEFGVITSFAYPVVGSDEKVVVATTRPETLFGDTAVAVHPDDPRYKHLHGKTLQHPLLDRQVPVITDSEAVDMEFGTGAVKITPAHDPNDYKTGKRHNLEFINIFNDDGTFNENAGSYKGMKRFDGRVKVLQELKDKDLFVEQKDNPMTIPLCEKSGDVIEPLMKPQWWVKQKPLAEEAIKAVKGGKITITPKASESEFFHWMNNIEDWCISRQLWWGHRCPIYLVVVDGEERPDPADSTNWIAGRSLEEAQEKASKKFPGKKITLEQDEDVLDTWFSSGLWPLTTLGWPKIDTNDFKGFFPQSLLETGWDILFFWVARMIMLGIKLTGEVPFTEVFCHSLIRDAQGRKMSKSLGNVVDPLDVIYGTPLEKLHEKLRVGNLDPAEIKKAEAGQKLSFPNGVPQCGTDALRFALCAYTTGGRDINLDIYRVEGYRKFCNKIYQATKFVLMRLGDDYKPPASAKLTGKETLVERWILAKLSNAAKAAAEHLDNRNFLEATNAIYNFWLYELCDVYIENSKFLILEGTPEEKASAQATLYTCIEEAHKLIHPFMPFVTEEMWQRLPHREGDSAKSIVETEYPSLDAFDEAAEVDYQLVLDVVSKARSLFAQYNILKNGKIIISAVGNANKVINEQRQSILSLVKLAAELELTKEVDTPEGSVVEVVSPECRVFVVVKGHVDFDEEIKKAQTKISKTEQQKERLQKQISVPDYETKVKESVREQNTKKLENLDAEIKSLNAVVEEFERLRV